MLRSTAREVSIRAAKFKQAVAAGRSAHHRTVMLLFLLLHPAAASPRDLVAQETTRRSISGNPTCPTCRLEVRRLFTLGSPTDPVLLRDFFPTVAVDESGNFFVSAAGGTFVVFDSTGAYVREAGRLGDGPGEFGRGSTEIFTVSPDTIIVLAGQQVLNLNRRWEERSRFSQPALTRLMARSIAALPDGSIIYTGNEPARNRLQTGPDTNRQLLHVFSPNGEAVSRIAGMDVSGDFCLSCEVLVLSRATAPGEFWSLRADEYLLQRWRKDGTLLETIAVSGSPWFTRWIAMTSNPPAMQPRWAPAMLLNTRKDGLLVVGSYGPSADYPAALARAVPPPPRDRMAYMAQVALRQASAFDIVDPGRGVLASTVIERMDIRPISPDYAIRWLQHPSGIMQIEVWRIEFSR
jgi:hypothetical protein